jgi:CRISPR system Cascade subunit CasA
MLQESDPLFIEVCRRVRLDSIDGRISARAGTSSGTRVAGKEFNGKLGDPWAPVNRAEAKSLTLGEDGDFGFAMITRLLLSGDWMLPLLATLGPGETAQARNWVLIAQAFARGNSKTGGFKERIIPVTGKAARAIGARRAELHKLATNQIVEIDDMGRTLSNAIALGAVGGDFDAVNKDAYATAKPYRDALRIEADRLFFPALWARLEAED